MAEPATFYAVFDRIAPANNKYMATLFNTSATRKVVLQRIFAYNWQVAAITTAVSRPEYIAKITARTAGTAVTIQAMDTNDSLSSGISADTNSTAVTESYIFRRMFMQSEEASGIGALNLEDYQGSNYDFHLIWERLPGLKGLHLRQNQGISIRNDNAEATASSSYVIVFSDEPA